MARRPDLGTLLSHAYTFAQDSLQDLLNRTITDGITIRAVLDSGRKRVWVGHRVSESDIVGQPIPIRLSGHPRCWIYLQHQFFLNDAGYLSDDLSICALYLDADSETYCPI